MISLPFIFVRLSERLGLGHPLPSLPENQSSLCSTPFLLFPLVSGLEGSRVKRPVCTFLKPWSATQICKTRASVICERKMVKQTNKQKKTKEMVFFSERSDIFLIDGSKIWNKGGKRECQIEARLGIK